MKRIKIAVLAVIFLCSFFMPSYAGGHGYDCAWICLGGHELSEIVSGAESYYFIFSFTNLLTCFFVITLLANTLQGIKILKWIGAFLMVHLCTWPLFHLCTWPSFVTYHGGSFWDDDNPDISDIGIGFYFWCFSIVLIWLEYCKSKKLLK
jgi:hypothetical protein